MVDEISDGLSADLVKVGERLRRLRKERGWKLEDLAERTSLSRGSWAFNLHPIRLIVLMERKGRERSTNTRAGSDCTPSLGA